MAPYCRLVRLAGNGPIVGLFGTTEAGLPPVPMNQGVRAESVFKPFAAVLKPYLEISPVRYWKVWRAFVPIPEVRGGERWT
jgi:hypothetical protein